MNGKYLQEDGTFVRIKESDEYQEGTNGFVAKKNPFRYRSYYYDEETNLYYLNSRYYDPELGRFINADDISILSESFNFTNGINLYSYCSNNPIMFFDPNGDFLIALILAFLGLATIAGAVASGVISYNNGARGWELAGKIFLGAAFGLAAGGAIVAGGAVFLGAFGVTTILGVSVLQIFAIGALAFNLTALIVAPILGIDMPAIEFETPSTNPGYKPPEYHYPSSSNFTLRVYNNLKRSYKNDRIFRSYIN